jgi:diguanylate cyclase (GGDEF)-like protein/PAS domain S-box-containing protein
MYHKNALFTKEKKRLRKFDKKCHWFLNYDDISNNGLHAAFTQEVPMNRKKSFDSDEKFRKIFLQSPIGICITNSLTGEILEMNERFASITGWTLSELETKDWMSITHPDDLQEDLEQNALMNSGKIPGFHMEKRYLKPDWSYVWINMSVVSMTSPGDETHIHLCMIEDITQQKLAENELRVSEQRLKTAQVIANVGNWEIDLNAKQVWASEQAYKIYGMTPEAPTLPLKTVQDIVAAEDRPMMNGALRALWDYDKPYDVVYRIRRANDHATRVIRSSAVMERRSDGAPLKAVGIIQDITEQRRTELALMESNIKLEATLQSTADGIEAIDLDGDLYFYNDRFKEMWGLPDNLTKESTFTFIAERIANVNTSLMNVRDLVKQLSVEPYRELQLKDGRTFERYAKPITVEGITEGYVLSYRDVSDRKKRETEILYLSYHDMLTGLYNRTFFEEECSRLDCTRQLPISVIVGDINGLKLVNDAFGHKEGDKLLIEMAKILSSSCRKEDILARTGGDEFCILLPQTSSEDARAICKRIYADCASYDSRGEKDAFYLSISLGCATKTDASTPIESILAEAEEYMYKQKLLERKSMRSSLLASIKTTMYEKSHLTAEHEDRLVALSKQIGQALELPDSQINELELLSTLHDIGKLSISDQILNKPGPLTGEEWSEIRKHPEVGYRIAQASPELTPIAEYILCHHERWDGTGYPQGLKGEAIPLLSRIVSVVDAYDAMTMDRPYRNAIPNKDAIAEIALNAGTQFDPTAAGILINILKNFDD